MDLKEEVRRRIADLTRAAYERGYRDGAQSALAEIESASAEDLAEQLKATPASLEALGKAAKPGRSPGYDCREAEERAGEETAEGEGERRHAQGRDRAALYSGADCLEGRGATR